MHRENTGATAAWTAAGCALAFAVLALYIHGAPGPPALDTALLDRSTAHRPEAAAGAARTATWTGTGLVPYLLAVGAGVLAGRTTQHRLLAVVTAALCLAVGQALRFAAMELFARDRPPVEEWATHASRHAFPSGHATTSALAAGLLILAVLLCGPPRKRLLVALIAVWGATVGLTRVYLGVHWFTDVLAGWLLAAAVLGSATWLLSRAARHVEWLRAVRDGPAQRPTTP